MKFDSATFLLFLPVVSAAFLLGPARLRVPLLLVASYYFYAAWKPEYLVLILGSTTLDYFAGIGIEGSRTALARRSWLVASVVGNMGILFAFKYLGFFSRVVSGVTGTAELFAVDLVLPVGISFYTFQSLGYSIDVFRGLPAERRWRNFALYVAFFPQLVAGPIERAGHLLPQFDRGVSFDRQRVVRGLRLVLWGLFKKVVIADRLALVVDVVYADPAAHSGLPAIVATWFFAFQIYCDFSAYSDIAVGSARILGFDLIQNFQRPYFSRSVPEFWRRWHVSLSTWFRDYVYLPLGGSRRSTGRTAFNLVAVFLLSGLWHGAAETFVVWGAVHGLFVLVSRLRGSRPAAAEPRWRQALRILVTFHLVCFGWVFFRAESVGDALAMLTLVLRQTPGAWNGIEPVDLTLGAALIALLLACDAIRSLRLASWVDPLEALSPATRRFCYVAMLLAILNLGVVEKVPFIYFQF